MTHVCHLCELPFPAWATQNHPLARSRDHIVPRHLGGVGLPNNTAPAHRCCNEFRLHHNITPKLRRRCRTLAEAEFRRVGAVPTVPDVPTLPELASSVAALPVHERRTAIVAVVADLARAYVGDVGVVAPSDLPRLRDAFENLARKYVGAGV